MWGQDSRATLLPSSRDPRNVRRLVQIVIFLVFVDDSLESSTVYAEVMFTFFGWVYAILIDPLPIKLRLASHSIRSSVIPFPMWFVLPSSITTARTPI